MKFTESEIRDYTETMKVVEACCVDGQDQDVLELFVNYLTDNCPLCDTMGAV